jgi:hypothetical protein
MIHEVLQDAHTEITPMEVADVLRSECNHQMVLRHLGEDLDTEPDAGDLLLRVTHDWFRATRFTKTYLPEAFGEMFRPPTETFIGGNVQVRYEGWVNDSPVFLEFQSGESYKRGGLPKSIQNAVAARAWLLGVDDHATVVTMDRNSQSWRAFQVMGDFTKIGEFTQATLEFFAQSLVGGQDFGASSSCGGCSLENSCEIDSDLLLDEVEPIPRANFRVVNDTGFITSMEKYLQSLNDRENGRMKKVIHPSEFTGNSAGKSCDRCIAYGLMGEAEERVISPKLYRIFHMGHAFHDQIQAALRMATNGEFVDEVKVDHGENLLFAGHCDGKYKKKAVEIKTMSTKGCEKLSRPKKDHIDQVTIYATSPQMEAEEEDFIYANKDTGELHGFVQKVSRKTWARLASRATRIVRSVKEGIMPDRIEKDYICAECKFRWKCRPTLQARSFFR